MSANHRYLLTRPELPPIEDWRPFLDEAYRENWFTNFAKLSLRFEHELAARWGFADTACTVMSSGTAALAAPLIARRIEGPVLLPAFTFPATLSAVKMAGAHPVLMDVSAQAWRVMPEALDAAFAKTRAKAALLLSPYGLKTDFAPHITIAQKHGAVLVIDSAAGLGLARDNVEASPDVFEAYSMHATKPFGIGEGGVVFSHRANQLALHKSINFGLPDIAAPGGPGWGINGKLSEMPAAVGLAVLQTLDERLARRRAFAARYIELLSRFGLPICADPKQSCWQVFPAMMPSERSATALVDEADKRGMEVRRSYRPSLSSLGLDGGQCPNAEYLASRAVCFPVYSNGTAQEQDDMLAIVEASLTAALA